MNLHFSYFNNLVVVIAPDGVRWSRSELSRLSMPGGSAYITKRYDMAGI
ncbi:MAG: hypothetical protein GF344_10880 [Chitinivibrionales bacterium]|nr:hypothetical protein [Chitinivibrionales bacterium]MBD3357307.1 hypothetical protein [Chitinivibrionales bacterium]